MNHGVGSDADKHKYELKKIEQSVKSVDGSSMLKNKMLSKTIVTRQVTFYVPKELTGPLSMQ